MAKYKVKGQTVNLTDRDFLSQGGEGSVYAKGNTAYKVYLDPKKMISLGKVQELGGITDSRVIKPEEAMYDGNTPVGYTMRYVKGTTALCQLFTKSFKDQNSIGFDQIVHLVKGMRATLDNIHSNNVLVVDYNEMNFLVNGGFDEVYYIDVDSYQTPNFHATALMESVRDRHSGHNQFSEETDWFAFAVVTFQLFIGIHPYKGRFKGLKGFDERMTNNVSVFHPDVKIPKNCYPFDVIPPALRSWYEQVFESTLRAPPPAEFDAAAAMIVKVKVIGGSDNFEIQEVQAFDSDVLYHLNIHGTKCTVADKKIYAFGAGFDLPRTPAVGIYGGSPYAVWREGDRVKIMDITNRKELHSVLAADSLMTTNGRIYLKSNESILELEIMGGTASVREVARILPKATKLYPGVAIQNMLGTWIANVFPDTHMSFQVGLKPLRGYQIVDAKFDGGILMVIGTKNGQYDRFVFKVNGMLDLIRTVEDITYTGLNFVTLDSGVCVMINSEEAVEAFNIKHPESVKVVEDDAIGGDMRLFKSGGKVMFARDNKLYNLRMK
jgi:serine/threonine protein kinase